MAQRRAVAARLHQSLPDRPHGMDPTSAPGVGANGNQKADSSFDLRGRQLNGHASQDPLDAPGAVARFRFLSASTIRTNAPFGRQARPQSPVSSRRAIPYAVHAARKKSWYTRIDAPLDGKRRRTVEAQASAHTGGAETQQNDARGEHANALLHPRTSGSLPRSETAGKSSRLDRIQQCADLLSLVDEHLHVDFSAPPMRGKCAFRGRSTNRGPSGTRDGPDPRIPRMSALARRCPSYHERRALSGVVGRTTDLDGGGWFQWAGVAFSCCSWVCRW